MFEPYTRKANEDRRSVALDPASMPTIKDGQILEVDAADGYAKLADSASLVVAPLWALTKTARLDVATAKAVSVIEAPFVARVGTDGYVGSPTAGAALGVGTTTDVGKLIVLTVDGYDDLQKVVAYCTKAPDSAGVMEFKAIR